MPAASVGAVAVLITAHLAGEAGHAGRLPGRGRRPPAATTTFAQGPDSTGFGLVPTDGNGRISVYNTSAAQVRLTVDVVGYFVGGIVTRPAHPRRLRRAHRRRRAVAAQPHEDGRWSPDGTVCPPGTSPPSLVNLQATAASAGRFGGVACATAGRPATTNVQLNAGPESASGLALVPVSPPARSRSATASHGRGHAVGRHHRLRARRTRRRSLHRRRRTATTSARSSVGGSRRRTIMDSSAATMRLAGRPWCCSSSARSRSPHR